MAFNVKENASFKFLGPVFCSSCSAHYSVRDGRATRFPMLLQCGHSICEFCLQKQLKTFRRIVCNECKKVSDPSLGFPFNVQLIGSIVVNLHLKQVKLREISNAVMEGITYLIKEPNSPSQEQKMNQCEECSMKAFWYCEICDSDFCNVCWCRVHENTKSLMRHCKTPLKDKIKFKFALRECPDHSPHKLEFYCKNCSIPICSHCIVSNHQGEGHCAITLKEKNIGISNEIKEAAERANMLMKKMKVTLEQIRGFSENLSGKAITDVQKEIVRSFSLVHGILQCEEAKLAEDLEETSNERREFLQSLEKQLEKQIESVDTLLRKSEIAVENMNDIDLQDLHEELKNVEELPCCFLPQKNQAHLPKVAFNESVLTAVRAFCKIDVPFEAFTLCSGSDLLKNRGESSSKESTPSGSTVKDEEWETFNMLLEKKNFTVLLSYLKNPGEFYVNLHSQRTKKSAIEKMCKSASLTTSTPENVVKEEIYLVQHSGDKVWYRGRVVNVPPEKELEADHFFVFYVDWGNSEKVPISRMKTVPDELSKEPPLAIKCKMYDCDPKNGEWCPEATKTMENILHNNTANLWVMRIGEDLLEVDLTVSFPEGVIGKEVISVRDALCFLEYTTYTPGGKFPRNLPSVKYPDQSLPPSGESFDGVLTFVQSPYELYVRRSTENDTWQSLKEELQVHYRQNKRGFLYNPDIGMPCAVLSATDNAYYRAKIIDIPGRKMIKVINVDSGQKMTVLWTSVRQLKYNFLRHPPLALRCGMVKINSKGRNWSPKAKSYLENLVSFTIRVSVWEKAPTTEKLNVVLYGKVENEEICLNKILEEGPMRFNPNFGPKKSSVAEDLKGENKGKKVKFDLSPTTLEDSYEIKKKFFHQEDSAEGTTSEGENKEDEEKNLKIKVKVLSTESPSCIYVTFPGLTEEFSDLHSKLNDFYKDSVFDEKKEWAPEEICVVYISEKKSWFRASILKILPEDQVEVFLKDVAEKCTLPISSLRELDPTFGKYGSCAVKCHLADVKPPGEEWPTVSSEYLCNELQNNRRIYITKKGEIEDKSLPVEFWIRKIESSGALDPINMVWINLNKLLVNQGLAVPKDPETWSNVMVEEIPPEEKTPRVLDLPWPSSEPLKVTQFVGMPTYIDMNANIYAYNIEDDAKLCTIQQTLQDYLEKMSPEYILDLEVGKPCVAKYQADQCWYRGRIDKVNDDETCEIFFVDYGNLERCRNSDLRRRLEIDEEFPTVTHKFQLADIRPLTEDQKWPPSHIELIHSMVVDHRCEISITSNKENGVHNARFKNLSTGLDVGEVLLSRNMCYKANP